MATEFKLSFTGSEVNDKLGKIDGLVDAEQRLTNELAVERARINSFTALGEGSTTGDAELQDIRVGADGVTYNTAGEAVRNQIGNLKSVLYQPISITETSGYYSAGGSISSASDTSQEVYTQRIPVNPGEIIRFSQNLTESKQLWAAAGLYNEAGTWMSREAIYTGTASSFSTDYVVPQNVAWISFTYRTYGISTVVVELNAISSIYDKNEINQKFEQMNSAVLDNNINIHGEIQIPEYELGVVYANNGALAYAERTYTIRPKKGFGVKLKAGDIVRTSRPDKYEMLGAYTVDGVTFLGISSRMDPYVAPEDGTYYISINMVPKTETASPDNINDFQFFRPASRLVSGATRSLFDAYKIKSINHRGYNRECPENTIPAFIMSAKKGFPIIETDLRFTSDGVAVLLHDASINRTARNADGSEISGTVNIADITYEQALTYDFGIWKGEKYAGTKIPTLAEAISVWKKAGLFAYIELESMTSAQIQEAVNIVKATNYSDYVTWISFNHEALAVISMIDPFSRLGFIVGNITTDNLDKMKIIKNKYNSVFIDADILNLTSDSLGLAKAAGEAVEVWTLNSETVLNELDNYVSGVTSDNLNAQEYFKNKLLGPSGSGIVVTDDGEGNVVLM